jgi:hypothetical protein
MAQDGALHIKLDKETDTYLKQLARARGTSKAQWVRDAITTCYQTDIDRLLWPSNKRCQRTREDSSACPGWARRWGSTPSTCEASSRSAASSSGRHMATPTRTMPENKR